MPPDERRNPPALGDDPRAREEIEEAPATVRSGTQGDVGGQEAPVSAVQPGGAPTFAISAHSTRRPSSSPPELDADAELHRATEAARDASASVDHHSTVDLVDKAVEEAAQVVAELRGVQAAASKWLGKNEAALQQGQKALDTGRHGSRAWCIAAGEAAAAAGKMGDEPVWRRITTELLSCRCTPDNREALCTALARAATQLVLTGAIDWADTALARIEELNVNDEDPPAMRGWVYEARAVRARAAGNPVGRAELAARAAQCFEDAGDHRNACLQRVSHGFACVESGRYVEATGALSSALVAARAHRLSNSIPIAQAQLARVLARQGREVKAVVMLESAIVAFDNQQNKRLAGAARTYLAQIHLERGRYAEAERTAAAAATILSGSGPLRRAAEAVRSRALVRQERIDEALALSEATYDDLTAAPGQGAEEALPRLAYAEALQASGRVAEAQAVAEDGARSVERAAAKITDSAWRYAFLFEIPEHETLRALAAELACPDES